MAAEVEHLRAALQAATEELAVERAHRNILQRAVLRLRSIEEGDEPVSLRDQSDLDDNTRDDSVRDDGVDDEAPAEQDGGVYVFDDEDASRAAFDEFFAAPDPHLDKVRGFLLD